MPKKSRVIDHNDNRLVCPKCGLCTVCDCKCKSEQRKDPRQKDPHLEEMQKRESFRTD